MACEIVNAFCGCFFARDELCLTTWCDATCPNWSEAALTGCVIDGINTARSSDPMELGTNSHKRVFLHIICSSTAIKSIIPTSTPPSFVDSPRIVCAPFAAISATQKRSTGFCLKHETWMQTVEFFVYFVTWSC